MPLHPLTNFEIQKYYQNKPRFNWWICRSWYTLDCFIFYKKWIVYFDSFSVEHVPEETYKFIGIVWVLLHWIGSFYACRYSFDWFYKFVFSLWFWKKWQYNFELFQIQMKLMKQTWLIKQNSDEMKWLRLKIILTNRLIKENHAVKKLSKYVASFDYIDKILIVRSATSSGVCFISSVSVVGAPVAIAGSSITLIFYLTTGTIKKLLSITRNKKKKHVKILMLAKSKFNSIETLVSQVPDWHEISHEEFITIFQEKDKYEMMKENLRNVTKKQENTRLKIVNLRTWMSGW